MLNRRTFTRRLLVGTVAIPALVGRALAEDEVRLAAILDLSGGLDIYGKPILMCMEMAVEEINASGGLNGRKLRLISYDTQSNMQLYAQYAQQAALQDKAHVVHGGITSASREVIRPILGRHKILYVYSPLYEGGVCDKNTFCTGTTPAMQVKEPLKWAISTYGKKIFAIGADYNFPRIIGDWTAKFAKENGASVVANEFFPLSVTEFGPIITRIQAEKPDFVVSSLVGAAHLGFYRQWAASGMLKKIPILSYTFGAGNENEMLPASDSEGIVAPYSYLMELDTPANKDWLARYRKKFGAGAISQNCISIGGYEGTMVWAEAVRKAGTIERAEVVKAFESGIVYEGPGGKVAMDGAVHHAARDIHLGRCGNKAWTILKSWAQQPPSDAGGQCDLIANPRLNKQFTPI